MISYETTRHVRDHCLCLHAQRIARTLARRFDEALRPLDLTNGQFSLLISLNRPQAAAIGPVARLLGMDRTTLTAALKPLQRRGLMEIVPDKDDKRSRLLKLTGAGHALLKKAVPIWERTHAEIDRELSGQDADRLRRAMRSLA